MDAVTAPFGTDLQPRIAADPAPPYFAAIPDRSCWLFGSVRLR
jgi:hypothetical protein